MGAGDFCYYAVIWPYARRRIEEEDGLGAIDECSAGYEDVVKGHDGLLPVDCNICFHRVPYCWSLNRRCCLLRLSRKFWFR